MRIVLATLNARYSHASFGLRCLLANLGPFRPQASLREFTIAQSPLAIVEELLAAEPTLLGLGVYIWNVTQTTEVVALLRVLRPELRIVLGGPEVSYEFEATELYRLCDHLITGEGDLAFRDLVAALAAGQLPPKLLRAAPPDIASLELPYDEYSDRDLRERLIYVEASRGCPFQCEFCLSSLDEKVRAFPLPRFLAAMARLLERGARGLKFVDRTFNLSPRTSQAILEFCLSHYRPGLELHFEMVPDRLPVELGRLLARFPSGAVQLELGIQSFDPTVLANISRPQNLERLAANLAFLRDETTAHVHTDLIIGLPGETLDSFAAGFDRLVAMAPEEIQLGFLKRLRGTPIIRHSQSADLRFSPQPPYEILETATIPFATLQRLKRFARYFDLYYNSGHFLFGMEALLGTAESPFAAFAAFADWLFATTRQTHEFALVRLYQLLFDYLTSRCGLTPGPLAESLLYDYDRHQVRRQRLEFLRPFASSLIPQLPVPTPRPAHGQKRRGQAPAIAALPPAGESAAASRHHLPLLP